MAQSSPISPVSVIALLEEQTSASPVVILYEPQSNKVVPIWIGNTEARAIAFALSKEKSPRPLTHELIKATIEKLGATCVRVIIDSIKDHTFYATIYLQQRDQTTIAIDARPSDAIALALETKAPLFVNQSVLMEAGQENPFVEHPSFEKRPQARPIKPKEISQRDLERLKDLLQKAREYEQKGGVA